MNILFLGDIVGRLGRETVKKILPDLRKKHNIDLVFANAENLAGGRGATPETLDEMLKAGVDYFTSGNHIFWQKNFEEILNDESFRLLRPANYPEDVPGKGWTEIRLKGKSKKAKGKSEEIKIVLINLIGQTLMKGPVLDPFRTADSILKKILPKTENRSPTAVIVDFHAEATSEKQALGFYLDGRVSAVVGTHTHVPTADTHLLPLSTAFVTDVGMIGSLNSVLGVKSDVIVDFLKYPYPKRFEWIKKGSSIFNSVLISLDSKGETQACERIDLRIG